MRDSGKRCSLWWFRLSVCLSPHLPEQSTRTCHAHAHSRCAVRPACAIAMIAGSNASVSADMNEWLNTLQSLQLPFALLPVLHFTNSRRYANDRAHQWPAYWWLQWCLLTGGCSVMGVFANSEKAKWMYWFMGMSLIGLNLYFVIDFAFLDDSSPIPKNWWLWALYASTNIIAAIHYVTVPK